MKRVLFVLIVVVACSILTIGLLKPVSTSATVPGVNEAVDISTTGSDPNADADSRGISQDGRYIVFQSTATNLVSPATNGLYQIFVRDRLNNTTTLVSVSSSGAEGNANSYDPKISATGRYIVFRSTASNLAFGATTGQQDIFLHDMSTGSTSLVSSNSSGVEGNAGGSQSPDVTADGNYVVFSSYATNLVSSPLVSGDNIYEKNVSTGEVKLLSQSASGAAANARSINVRISCEGRFVVFDSEANNLVSGDPNPTPNLDRIYVIDMLKPIAPMYIMALPNSNMGDASISCNGNYIAFGSNASNIVPNDTNGQGDAFLYDRINNTFRMVSVATDGTQSNGNVLDWPNVSNDGKYVVFDDSATNLVPESGVADNVFLHNTQTGTTELIDRNVDDVMADHGAGWGFISSDGRYVGYSSGSDNLVSGFSATTGGAVYSSQTGATDDY